MEGKSGASSRGNSSSKAYIKVVAVKKLVVGSAAEDVGPPIGCVLAPGLILSGFPLDALH